MFFLFLITLSITNDSNGAFLKSMSRDQLLWNAYLIMKNVRFTHIVYFLSVLVWVYQLFIVILKLRDQNLR